MIDEDGLNIWYEQRLVGYLWRNAIDYIGFRYDKNWLMSDGFAVSRMLPLQAGEFAPEQAVAHRFFANLLPEGGARENVVRNLKIANTDFALLAAIGGECAGALSVLAVEQEPSEEYRFSSLDDDDMARLITRRGQLFANLPQAKRPRLSLAGAQDKCAVMFNDAGYFFPIGDTPSTHILKFESPDYRNLPVYEVFTSKLAKLIGLPVVDIELRETSGKQYAQIMRYDRLLQADNRIKRIHQEDFCQALGYSHTRKYQHDGGPAFAQCLGMLRDTSDDPASDVQHLLKWQIFNVLAGNSDGHAKNLSLLYLPDGRIRMAPFYDLICTRAIERIDANLAFDIGGQRNPANVSRDDWIAFANASDVGSRYVLGLVSDIAALLLKHLPETRQAFEQHYGKAPALQRIEKTVTNQCKRVATLI
ncbi:MAG: type II toxin-antitoxin system HipA family toxin [Granulosicoccus sp.]